MLRMRRSLTAVAAVALLLAIAAATTWAVATPKLGSQPGATVQLGGTSVGVHAPVCPAGVKPQNCIFVMTRVTALETMTNGSNYPTGVKQSGQLVGVTIGLAQLS